MAAFLDLTTSDIGVFFSLRGSITPVIGENILATYTVPAGSMLVLRQLESSSLHPGRVDLFKDGSQINSIRLNAATVSYQTFYSPDEQVLAGEEIELKFDSRSGQSPSDISWSLTGYLVS